MKIVFSVNPRDSGGIEMLVQAGKDGAEMPSMSMVLTGTADSILRKAQTLWTVMWMTAEIIDLDSTMHASVMMHRDLEGTDEADIVTAQLSKFLSQTPGTEQRGGPSLREN
jgi:hypothetical protein